MNNLVALIPIIATLALAFTTRNVILAFIVGIISSSLIATSYSIKASLHLMVNTFLNTVEISQVRSWSTFIEADRLLLFIFLFCIGILIALIEASGGAKAYSSFVKQYLTKPRHAELGTLSLSSLIFLDDYFNTITAGSIAPRLTDSFKIPRVRIAQLINSLAAPLAALTPISTWGAAITGTLAASGVYDHSKALITLDSFNAYIGLIPFALYPLGLVYLTWVSSYRGWYTGVAAQHLAIAQATGDLFGGKAKKSESAGFEALSKKRVLAHFIVPITSLIVGIVLSILYFGDAWIMGGSASISQAFAQTHVGLALNVGGFITLIGTTIWFAASQTLSLSDIKKLYVEGSSIMWPSILMLSFAWTFGTLISDKLHAGQLLVETMLPSLSGAFLPAALFIMGGIISFSVGSAWGTMAILYPIAVSMITSFTGSDPSNLALASLGAVLSGSLVGNNLSPLADLTIMISHSTGASHMALIWAQTTHALPVLIGSLIGYITSGFIAQSYSWWLVSIISLAVTVISSIALIWLLHIHSAQKNNSA
jgi:Na+/H+ antiporter NhaC